MSIRRMSSSSEPVRRVAMRPVILQTSAQSRLSLTHWVNSLTIFLGKASVGARGARLGAGITRLDATDQSIVGASAHIWVHTDHLLNLHAFLSGWRSPPCG
jgi:hypothetical protein